MERYIGGECPICHETEWPEKVSYFTVNGKTHSFCSPACFLSAYNEVWVRYSEKATEVKGPHTFHGFMS